MKRIALALLLALIPQAALAQAPEVEIQLWNTAPGSGEVGVYMDPATPCNVMWVEVNGYATFAKGGELPNPDAWYFGQTNGGTASSAFLLSFTEVFAEGRAFAVTNPGCDTLALTPNCYVQRWPAGWLQDRPLIEGTLAGKCAVLNTEKGSWGAVKGLFR